MRSSLSLVALVISALPLAAQTPAPSGPPVTITLKGRHGHATPIRQGFTHTGGGNIDVAASPDTVVITMAASPWPARIRAGFRRHARFRSGAEFRGRHRRSKVGKAKVSLGVIGLLRPEGHGRAGQASPRSRHRRRGVVTLCVPRTVCGGETCRSTAMRDRWRCPSRPGAVHAARVLRDHRIASALPAAVQGRLGRVRSGSGGSTRSGSATGGHSTAPAKKDFGFQVILKVAGE